MTKNLCTLVASPQKNYFIGHCWFIFGHYCSRNHYCRAGTNKFRGWRVIVRGDFGSVQGTRMEKLRKTDGTAGTKTAIAGKKNVRTGLLEKSCARFKKIITIIFQNYNYNFFETPCMRDRKSVV